MDQTENNLDRIRAFDAEEGEWRTINGAHVLIKNGRIAGGAGGALNGQPFRGGSLKKMQAGSKGVNSDVYGNRLDANAKKKERDFKYNEQFRERQLNRALNEAMQDPEIVGRTRTGIPGVHGRPIASSSSLERIRRAEENYSELRKKLYAESENEEKALAEAKNKASAFNGKRGDRVERARKTLERLRQGRVNQAASTASSLTKMPAGQKGMESGSYGRKLKTQAKEVAEKNRAAMARANAKYDRNRNARLEQMGNLMAKASVFPDYSALASMYRNAYEKLAREDQREGRATAATTNALNQEIYDLEGKAARHESKRGEVASRAQRALERYRKSREAERGGSAVPQQSAAYNTGKKRALEHIKRLTNEGHEDPEALAAVKAEASSYVKKWRDIAKRNPGDETAEKQLGWYETLEKGWGDMLNSVNRSKSRSAVPQQSAAHATKLGRMQPGSTAVNAGNEAKRLDHNARVYHRTARRAREAYNARMDKAGGDPNAIEQKKNAYKAKSDENVIRRDQAAASAKERLSKLRQLANSLKARNPNAFKG